MIDDTLTAFKDNQKYFIKRWGIFYHDLVLCINEENYDIWIKNLSWIQQQLRGNEINKLSATIYIKD